MNTYRIQLTTLAVGVPIGHVCALECFTYIGKMKKCIERLSTFCYEYAKCESSNLHTKKKSSAKKKSTVLIAQRELTAESKCKEMRKIRESSTEKNVYIVCNNIEFASCFSFQPSAHVTFAIALKASADIYFFTISLNESVR